MPPDSPHAQALKHEAALLGRSRDTYLFHEHLEADNHPVYYHEFVSAAAAAGLTAFAPARFDVVELGLAPEVRQTIARIADDPVRREQYRFRPQPDVPPDPADPRQPSAFPVAAARGGPPR